MVDRATALLGTDERVPEAQQLRAGPVTATLENGQLRWVKVAGVEALRSVSFLIRDSTWLTAAPEILDLRVDQRKDSFSVEFAARCVTKDGEITHAHVGANKCVGTYPSTSPNLYRALSEG